jgi:hypothetical protein
MPTFTYLSPRLNYFMPGILYSTFKYLPLIWRQCENTGHVVVEETVLLLAEVSHNMTS